MKRTITVHLYDQYESDQSLIRRIDAIREKTHQAYGQILTEILMNKEAGVAGLSDQAVARIAEKTAEIILERLPQIFSDLWAKPIQKPVSFQT